MHFLIAFDRLINTILGGWCGETLSSRLYREQWTGFETIVNTLFFWQDRHCFRSYLWDKHNKDFPEHKYNGRGKRFVCRRLTAEEMVTKEEESPEEEEEDLPQCTAETETT